MNKKSMRILCEIENWGKPLNDGGEKDDEGWVTLML